VERRSALTLRRRSAFPERTSISERARSAAITIETAGGRELPVDGGSYDWRDFKRLALGKALRGARAEEPDDGRV
jgi:hypothetical protein